MMQLAMLCVLIFTKKAYSYASMLTIAECSGLGTKIDWNSVTVIMCSQYSYTILGWYLIELAIGMVADHLVFIDFGYSHQWV